MTTANPLLICTDLDRTLLPNGLQEESSAARPLFKRLVAHPEVRLAYVSGRDKQLLLDAIAEYELPLPDYAIADVGTSLYVINDQDWQLWPQWHAEIGRDWDGYSAPLLAEQLRDLPTLQLQEAAKQGRYKLSYYVAVQNDIPSLLQEIKTRLDRLGVNTNLIWSIDETCHTGLLDILPQGANKLHAIRFLMQQKGFTPGRTVFAGDSGNDLEVLCSELQATLVANATDAVRQQALDLARQNGHAQQLYCARGGFMGMNGNYAAGILEGVVHYVPELIDYLK